MRGPHEAHAGPCAATCSQGAERVSTDVIRRGADEADRLATIADLWDVIEANGATNSRLMRERDEAWAALKAERVISRSRDATIERLWAQLNEATNVPDDQGVTSTLLIEATGVESSEYKHNDPEFGFDKTAALSDPDEDAPCPDSCGGQSWTRADTSRGKRWRCDTCGRIISRYVSDAVQAAVDRRSL